LIVLQNYLNTKYGLATNANFVWFSFIITAAVSILSLLLQLTARPLTQLEKHQSWSTYIKHEAFKLIFFKIGNVIALYVSIGVVSIQNASPACFLEQSGIKFLTLIITDLIVFNSWELISTALLNFASKYIKKFQGKGGDVSSKPEFDVAQEYLEVFYRQFVIYMGMLVVPIVPIIGILANIIEFQVDKYRMLRLCQPPKRLDLSMKRFLLFWLIMSAFLAFISWPQAGLWVLSDITAKPDVAAYSCCGVINNNILASFNCSTAHIPF